MQQDLGPRPRLSSMYLGLLATAVTLIMMPVATYAAPFTLEGLCGPDTPLACTASITFDGGVALDQLQMTFTNTSTVSNGGYLTAVSFSLAGSAQITAFTTSHGGFTLYPQLLPSSGGSFNVAPDGTREFVVTATPGVQPYLGGGGPDAGLAPGNSATFKFTLSNFGSVTALSVFDSVLVRGRGFLDGQSDKDSLTPVPEPSSVLLLGSGLAGVALWIRRRRPGRPQA